ncbi:MAG: uracil-DNA glycosylase [Chloroflexi bacterium]|nr:uracil-DNA glycosylase [Chloroflexota bacterium]
MTRKKTDGTKGLDLKSVSILMIAEALPENETDSFYTSTDSLYVQNTIRAFQQAGFSVHNIADITNLGVHLTVAVKEPRPGVSMPRELIEKYAPELEAELAQFPNLKVLLLMGDVAIKTLNLIARRTTGKACIPTGSTYKIRYQQFFFEGMRVFPSYLQTGKNFLIEKAKQRMVTDDIRRAFVWLEKEQTHANR